MEKRITISAEETRELGKTLGKSLQGGESIALYGDLGSGKTTFVQGIAEGLGISRRVVSPTFLILKTYPLLKRKNHIETFYHADLYRIENTKDVESIGLTDILQMKDAVVVIEWPEKIEQILPESTKRIRLSYISEHERDISYE